MGDPETGNIEPSIIPPDEGNPYELQPETVQATEEGRIGLRGLARHHLNRLRNRSARHELVHVVEDVSSRIDYDAVVAYYMDRSVSNVADPDDIAENAFQKLAVLHHLNTQIANGSIKHIAPSEAKFWLQELTTGYPGLSEDNAKGWVDKWQAMGFLQPVPTANRRETGPLNHEADQGQLERLTAKGNRALADLREFERFTDVYRRERHIMHFEPRVQERDFAWTRIINALGQNYGREAHSALQGMKMKFDPKLLAAVEHAIDNRIDYYAHQGMVSQTFEQRQQMLEHQRAQTDWDTLAQSIPINGLDEQTVAPNEFPLFTRGSFLSHLRGAVPAPFLAGVGSINFQQRSAAANSHEPTSPHTVGLYTYKTFLPDGSTIPARIDIFSPASLPFTDPSVPNDQRMATLYAMQLEVVETAAHEIGHNAHHYNASLDELRGWEDVISRDRIAASKYVSDSRAKDEAKGKYEDFCETFGKFAAKPFELFILSRARYDYMKEFVLARLPETDRQEYSMRLDKQLELWGNFWRKAGLSDEALKRKFQPWLRDERPSNSEEH